MPRVSLVMVFITLLSKVIRTSEEDGANSVEIKTLSAITSHVLVQSYWDCEARTMVMLS